MRGRCRERSVGHRGFLHRYASHVEFDGLLDRERPLPNSVNGGVYYRSSVRGCVRDTEWCFRHPSSR